MHFLQWIQQPWPWYIGGPLIGLTVPILLIIGNKTFGISSSLRHICAACIPARITFFSYDWKKELWNLFFVTGIFLGGIIAVLFLANPVSMHIAPKLAEQLSAAGITDYSNMVPLQLFNWSAVFTLRGLIMMVGGGLLVGFGTRYAGGCTSGHAIMGLSNMQFPSLVATVCFMAGGFIVSNYLLPFILTL